MFAPGAGSENKQVGHLFQYLIWKDSLDVKYYIYVSTIILFAIISQVLSFFAIREQGRVKVKTTELNTLLALTVTPAIQAQIDTAYGELGNLSDNFISYINALISIYIIMIGSTSVQDLIMMLYSSMAEKYINTYTFWELINLISSLITIVWISKHFGNYAANLGDVRDELKATTIIQRMEDDHSFNIKVTLALLLAIHYTRIIISLQVSRTFGPMVRILKSMIVDIIVFLIFFAAMIAIFAGAGQLMFYELPNYSDIGEATKVLFSSAIGQFDYSTYDGLTSVNVWVGYIYITVFVVIFNIMLLNFLIAVLSNTYEQLNTVKDGLYLKNVISLRREHRKTPLDVLLSFCLPLTFYGNFKTLDICMMIFQYSWFGVLAVVIFFAASTAMIPIAYWFVLLQKIRYWAEKPFQSNKDFIFRLCDLALFFFLGVFFLLFWVMLDTASFVVSLFDTNVMPIDEYEHDKLIDINNHMDASKVKDSDDAHLNSMISAPVYSAKSSGKGSNPIKDGLADTTLHILKATLKTMNDKHNRYIAKNK